MKSLREQLLLYGVTDRGLSFCAQDACNLRQSQQEEGKRFLKQIETALSSGVTMLQLREKNLSKDAFLKEALAVRKLTGTYKIPLIINDDIEIALACGADGVHIGQQDVSPAKARAALGPDRILGVTAHTVEEAKLAWENGADYLGCGAVFPTVTKNDAQPMTLELLAAICRFVPVPVVAIGGINGENVSALADTGIAGAAVVSGIFGQPDIALAVRSLKKQLESLVNP